MSVLPRPAPFDHESGSILIYIFLAIALFAALSFAVANIMRSGGGNPTREVMGLQSTDAIQYGDAIKRGVQSMRIRGIEDTQISFEDSRLANYAPHGSCSTDGCRVFQPAGGGVAYVPPPDDWLDSTGNGQPLHGEWFFPTGTCVEDAGTGGAGCETDGEDNEDLVAILPWVKRDLCIQINEKLGITNPAGEPPTASGAAWTVGNTKFTGTFTEDAIIARGGETAGCLRGNGTPASNTFFYYKVLLAR